MSAKLKYFFFFLPLIFIQNIAFAEVNSPTLEAVAAWENLHNTSPNAKVFWSKYGYAEKIKGLSIEAESWAFERGRVDAVISFLIEYQDLFGLSESDIAELVVAHNIPGLSRIEAEQIFFEEQSIFSPLPRPSVIRFTQYKNDIRVRGGSVTFVVGTDDYIRTVYNESVPSLQNNEKKYNDDIAREILLEEYGEKVTSDRIKTELIILGHESDRLAWQVSSQGYGLVIDADSCEIIDTYSTISNYTTAQAKVYDNRSAYLTGTETLRWLWNIDTKWWVGSMPVTRPFGRHVKMYDWDTISGNNIGTIPSNDKVAVIIPYFNYTDTARENAIGNIYWYLENVAYEYENKWGFPDLTPGDEHYHLTIINHWDGSAPNCDGSCLVRGGFGDFGKTSTINSAHDDWPAIALKEDTSFGNTGDSTRPVVIYHEYNHYVAYSLTGYINDGTNACTDNWLGLDEALAKFMSESQYDAVSVTEDEYNGYGVPLANNWQADQFCCYPDQYQWNFVSNWHCCRQEYNGNNGDSHDFCLSLTQALWEARTSINYRNMDDGKEFVNQAVYNSLLAMDDQESCFTGAHKIYDAAQDLVLEWCDGLSPCPYLAYDDDVYNALWNHGYLREVCLWGDNPPYAIDDDPPYPFSAIICPDPGSVFCPRRDPIGSAPDDCTEDDC